MALVKWDPFASISALQNRINRIFEDAFPSSQEYEDEGILASAWKPVADIYETDQLIVITMELPGVKKEEISIEIKDNLLTIKGERTADKEINVKNYYRKERIFGAFHRAFRLQEVVQSDKIKAKFKDGILEVEVPKSEKEQSKNIKVNIE